MRARLLAAGVCVCAALVLLAGALDSACLNEEEQNTLEDVPFDGSFLGSCQSGASKTISAAQCPAACSGPKAIATCVGTSYGVCSCIPTTATTCDSGCCASGRYTPTTCTGKVATLDPSEDLCDAANGYLLCNGACYASFACELPEGYTVVTTEAGEDAGVDADRDAGRDATADVSPDGPGDTGVDAQDGEAGGSLDGGDAASDAHAEAGDGGPTDGAPADAHMMRRDK
jgi:hypothetical protein